MRFAFSLCLHKFYQLISFLYNENSAALSIHDSYVIVKGKYIFTDSFLCAFLCCYWCGETWKEVEGKKQISSRDSLKMNSSFSIEGKWRRLRERLSASEQERKIFRRKFNSQGKRKTTMRENGNKFRIFLITITFEWIFYCFEFILLEYFIWAYALFLWNLQKKFSLAIAIKIFFETLWSELIVIFMIFGSFYYGVLDESWIHWSCVATDATSSLMTTFTNSRYIC